MRLDVFLKRTGIFKQRALAKETCDRGGVTVDGRPARASREVEPGQVVRVETEREELELQVVGLPERNYRRKAGEVCYRVKSRKLKTII